MNHSFAIITAFALAVLTTPARAASPLTYVSLSYDDALVSQLDNAVPALDRHQFNASFYLVPANPGFFEHKARWKALSENGHELGNHSYTHPCRGSLPDRDWVEASNDLDTLSVTDMLQQVQRANDTLHALDGADTRTYTIPCGDRLANGENYLPTIAPHVYAIKGMTLPKPEEVIISPTDVSPQALIALLESQPDSVRIINVIFHGVGGDYLSVSNEAHLALLDYLDANRDRYVVDTYISIAKKVKEASE